jgi:hypothetical protein
LPDANQTGFGVFAVSHAIGGWDGKVKGLLCLTMLNEVNCLNTAIKKCKNTVLQEFFAAINQASIRPKQDYWFQMKHEKYKHGIILPF